MNGLRKKINPLALLLFLPVFALAAAADDPHPLHGTWIAEEDGSEWELALHPDGTFRMTVTTSEGFGFGEGEFDEDEFDEDEFDEDEFDEDESWEDILADLDSNENGVIDEEDYQAAQARGDEDLDESWDEVLEGDINGDGVIDEEEYNFWGEEDEDWEGVDPFAGPMTEIFGDEIVMTMVVTGTWEVEDDHFTLEGVETVIEINDMTMAEFYTEIFNAMIDAIFEESGLNEDEFIAMISEADDTITAETLDELKANTVDELLVDMDEVAAPPLATETFEYAIDGDEMIATDSFGDPQSFVRLDAQSAVEAISWGQIKALSR